MAQRNEYILFTSERCSHRKARDSKLSHIYIWVKWCPRGQANKKHTRAKGPTEIQMKFYESDQHIVIGTEHRLGLKYGKTLSGKEFAQNL